MMPPLSQKGFEFDLGGCHSWSLNQPIFGEGLVT
jgi:hypothetical protein